MECKVRDIVKLMEEAAPPCLAEDWDNTGLLAGSFSAPVQKVLVTLDVTNDVIDDAINKKADMIISHHPVIFKPARSVTDDDTTGLLLMRLLRAGISVYCAHTNLDKAKGGIDDSLAGILGLTDVQPLTWEPGSVPMSFSETGEGFSGSKRPSFGRIGRLKEKMRLEDYLKLVSALLNAGAVDFTGDPMRSVQVVASCAGAGGDFIDDARKAGADLFVTGEIKYHEFVPMLGESMAVAAFGHYATEMPGIMNLIKRLQIASDALQYKIEIVPTKNYDGLFRRLKG